MTAAESVVGRAARRGQVGNWWAILIPIIIEALQAFLENCEFERADFVRECANPSRGHRRRLRRYIVSALWSVRNEYGYGALRCIAVAASVTEDLVDEAKETVKRVGGGDELGEAYDELRPLRVC